MPEMQHGMVVDGHLGGYVPGGDDATHYPALWEWLVREHGVESVLDVGCGDGVALDYFLRLGADAVGVDGIPQEHDLITEHDYTTGPLYFDRRDLVWSCEFVEHVAEEFVGNFLASFECGDLVLMTHAEPGQAGWHHVNCKPMHYWTLQMEGIGYRLDQKLTNRTRDLARSNPNPYNHYARSGLAFVRE